MNVPADIRLIDVCRGWRERLQKLLRRHAAPLLGNQSLRRLSNVHVRMLQCLQEFRGSRCSQIRNVQEFALLMVHAPNTPEIMIAVRTHRGIGRPMPRRSEEHTSELQSRQYLVCRLLLEKKKNN